MIPASFSVGYSEDHIVGNVYQGIYEPLEGKVDGCVTTQITADLDVATNQTERVVGPERAKRESAVAARQRKLAAERRQLVLTAEAQAAEQRRKVRAACSDTYQKTADKKVADLTVLEEQQVRACQAFSMYPPR